MSESGKYFIIWKARQCCYSCCCCCWSPRSFIHSFIQILQAYTWFSSCDLLNAKEERKCSSSFVCKLSLSVDFLFHVRNQLDYLINDCCDYICWYLKIFCVCNWIEYRFWSISSLSQTAPSLPFSISSLIDSTCSRLWWDLMFSKKQFLNIHSIANEIFLNVLKSD